MHFEIRTDDPDRPEVTALIKVHLDICAQHSPPESVHALDSGSLRSPDVTFWTAWDGAVLLGCWALKEPGSAPRRGQVHAHGCGASGAWRRRILTHIVETARGRAYGRLSLETGSMDAFAAARALYARFGFVTCGPFAAYRLDPYSEYMTLALVD